MENQMELGDYLASLGIKGFEIPETIGKKNSKKPANVSKPITSTSKNVKPANASKNNVIQFPKKPQKVEPIQTDGNACYVDCVSKLADAKKKYIDADSQYVIDGLLELCLVDSNFCNRVMLPEKSYDGAYKYLFEMARNGVGAYKSGNMAMMDKDTALGLCIDYFNKGSKTIVTSVEISEDDGDEEDEEE